MRAASILLPTKWWPLAAGLWLIACNTPAPAESEFWRPWYEVEDAAPPDDPQDLAADQASRVDLAGRVDLASHGPQDLSATDGMPDLSSMPQKCTLDVSVTTVSPGGKYSPRNIGAIWVSDASDRFIRTLSVWADRRAKYLKRWNDTTAAAKVPADRTDAISSATKSSHGLRGGTWNCTDLTAAPVPDGTYKICFELTDYDGSGPNDCVSFTKSAAPFSLMPPDVRSFTARKLELKP